MYISVFLRLRPVVHLFTALSHVWPVQVQHAAICEGGAEGCSDGSGDHRQGFHVVYRRKIGVRVCAAFLPMHMFPLTHHTHTPSVLPQVQRSVCSISCALSSTNSAKRILHKLPVRLHVKGAGGLQGGVHQVLVQLLFPLELEFQLHGRGAGGTHAFSVHPFASRLNACTAFTPSHK